MYTLWSCGYLHRAVVWEASDSVSEGNTATIFRVEMNCILMMQAAPPTCSLFSYQTETRCLNIDHNMNGKYDLKVTGSRTSYSAGRSGVRFSQEARDFFFCKMPRPTLQPTQPPISSG